MPVAVAATVSAARMLEMEFSALVTDAAAVVTVTRVVGLADATDEDVLTTSAAAAVEAAAEAENEAETELACADARDEAGLVHLLLLAEEVE